MSASLRLIAAITMMALMAWSAFADPPKNLSDVISITDLESEVASIIAEIKSYVATLETYQGESNKLRHAATQLAVLSQALSQYDAESRWKAAAPAIRDSALRLGHAPSFEDAKAELYKLQQAVDSQSKTTSVADYDWSKLASKRALMDSLRERGDRVRKVLRRSKDPELESRHAATMAVLAQAILAHSSNITNPSDRQLWNNWSTEFQTEMTKTAAAIRHKDAPAILEHFTAAQEACDRCHEKFKK